MTEPLKPPAKAVARGIASLSCKLGARASAQAPISILKLGRDAGRYGYTAIIGVELRNAAGSVANG